MKLIMLIMFVITLSRSEDLELNIDQLNNAKLIERVSKGLSLSKASKHTETLIMISLQESDLGEKIIGDNKAGKPITKASLGMFHMRIITVRELQRFFPEKLGYLKNLTDKQIANLLLSSKGFSAILANYNLERIAIISRGNYNKMVSQWNGGLHNMPYVNAVLEHKKLAKAIMKYNSKAS